MVFKKYDKGGCVGCPPDMGCLGSVCPQCWEIVMKCDVCGKTVDELHVFDGEQMCNDCFFDSMSEMYPNITDDNAGEFVS